MYIICSTSPPRLLFLSECVHDATTVTTLIHQYISYISSYRKIKKNNKCIASYYVPWLHSISYAISGNWKYIHSLRYVSCVCVKVFYNCCHIILYTFDHQPQVWSLPFQYYFRPKAQSRKTWFWQPVNIVNHSVTG